jgi:hypothetical protein
VQQKITTELMFGNGSRREERWRGNWWGEEENGVTFGYASDNVLLYMEK